MGEVEGGLSKEDAADRSLHKVIPQKGEGLTFVHGVPTVFKKEGELDDEQARSVLKQSENTKEAKKAAKQRAKEIRSLLKRLNDQNDQGRIQRDGLLSELQSLG